MAHRGEPLRVFSAWSLVFPCPPLAVEEWEPALATAFGTFGFHFASGDHVTDHEQVHAQYPAYDAHHEPG